MPNVSHGTDSLVATHATEVPTTHAHHAVKGGLSPHSADPHSPYTAPSSGHSDEKRGAFNQKEFFTKADWREEAARLFQTLDVSGNGQVLKEDLFDHVRATGIRLDDRRLHGFVATLKRQPGDTVNFNTFLKATMPERLLIDSIMKNQLVIPNWKEFREDMGGLFEDCKQFRDGDISKYIPPLARQDPELWGVAVCTVDGQRAGWGDVTVPYSAQSTAKSVTYCMARELHDEESVHSHVGREPSGRDFNELVLNRHGRPHNPLINAGAIMTSALIHTKQPLDYRLEQLLLLWQHMCGSSTMPHVDDDTYQSELSVGHRNRALGYLMAERDAFPEGSDLDAALTLYFKQCSIRMTAEQQAVFAATLAAGGVCPITGRRALQPETVQACLSLMLTCGMLDYSGKYCYRIGLPAKSGICGAVMIIVPGVMGIVTFSPRVDRMGNSVRGVKFSKELVQRFKFHQFDIVNTGSGSKKKDPANTSGDEGTVVSMLYAAADGELDVIRYLANEGIDLSQADYDSRTALHLAAAENHYNVAFFLLTQGVTGSARDRWGTTPLDEARHILAKNPSLGSNMVELLQQAENGDLPLYDPPHGQEVSSFEDYDENERESFHTSVQTWKLPILRNTQGKYVYVPRDQWNIEAFTAPNGSRPLDRDRKGVVTVEEFSALCAQHGIRPNDRRLNGIYGLLLEKGTLSVNTFLGESLPGRTLLKSMIGGLLVVPEWKKYVSDIRGLFESVRHRKEGENAHYIPPLRDADPEKWGLAICTVDGQQAAMGDSKIKYTAQSTSKPLTYCLARQLHGEEKTHQHVGHEPSGRLFNEVVLNKRGRPHNPCINAGAIMCASLIETTRSVNHRMATLLEMWRRVMGEEVAPGYSEEVYQGETSTANRNRCLTYFMAEMNAFPEGNDLEASLSLYFKACSIEVNVEQHAVAAATLASGGICPITGERVFDATTVQNCLSLMQTCGMYDYSGEFCYRIGLPAKSGVAGAVMVVVPNVMGIVTFSPRLDEMGNSVRGVAFCEALVSRFAFHQYIVGTAGRADPTNKKHNDDSATAALWAARRGDLKALQALGASGTDLSSADYDGRTPLHLAAAEGHAECAYYISNRPTVDINAVDRFGNTALDEARRIGADRCVEVLQQGVWADAGSQRH